MRTPTVVVPYSAFYETASGVLLSLGTVVEGNTIAEADAALAVRGITRDEVPASDMDPGGKHVKIERMWDEATKGFVDRPLRVRVRVNEFYDRFTRTEWEDVVDAADSGNPATQKALKAFFEYVKGGPAIEVSNQYVIDVVNQMESGGLIAPGKALIILAGPE